MPAHDRPIISFVPLYILPSRRAEVRVMLPRPRGAIVNIAFMYGIIVNYGLCQAHCNPAQGRRTTQGIYLMVDSGYVCR